MFGFLKRAKTVVAGPSADAEPDRYKGRPLLIILEQYVLHCIGVGDDQSEARMRSIVQRVWGGDNDWMQTVRSTLDLEPQIDDAIRQLWTRNQEIAGQHAIELHPVQFAKMFAETNFVPIIDKL